MADRRRTKDSGTEARKEGTVRQEQHKATAERKAKADREGGTAASPPAVSPVGLSAGAAGPVYAEENRQDVIAVVGHQYRDSADVKPDPGFQFDGAKAQDGTQVDHLAVAANTEQLFLELNGEVFRFDVELALALYRLVNAASTALNN